ncbi:hypothetical protein E4U42_005034 [Claviceps africana]|uniref:Uncharacterized protein n=1 Tax=Claviceps africana TaxID=83212 RepID=A0A8K0J447_9HYPO|nr:hypothetical protein E4U42_005034 [Claviceps africana]
MDINAFGDPRKLADARALADSFKAEKKGRVSSRWARAEDAVQFVEVKDVVPPSQRHYHGNVLEKGWKIPGFSLDVPVMSGAMDFLHRADQAPECLSASEADKLAVDHSVANTSDGQKTNDEVNAERLSELLHSFSFKEAKEGTENASGSIMETFLALLAESTNLLDDEPGKVEASTKAKSVQQDFKLRVLTPSPKKTTQLQPEAQPFVPCGPHAAECVHERKRVHNSSQADTRTLYLKVGSAHTFFYSDRVESGLIVSCGSRPLEY